MIAASRQFAFFALLGGIVLSACAPAAAPQQAPAAPPAQPAQPAPQPAPQPAKPAEKPVVELRAGSSFNKGNFISDGLDKFAELVETKTNGEVRVRVLYQTLGAEQQLTQSVMDGSVDIGMISNGNAGRFTTAFFVYDLPFLFNAYDNMLKSLEGPIGRKAIAQFEKDLDLKYLFPMSNAQGRDIQTRNKLVKTPADLKGMKIRVVSTPVDLAIFRAWGANPTPVDWAQTYSALQQGVVDGLQNTLIFTLSAKVYEVVKYDVRLDYQGVFANVHINAQKYAALSPQHQKALLEAAEEAKKWQYADIAERAKQAASELTTKHGMTIYQPTPAEYGQWTSIREKVWAEVAEAQKGKIDLDLAKQLYQSQ